MDSNKKIHSAATLYSSQTTVNTNTTLESLPDSRPLSDTILLIAESDLAGLLLYQDVISSPASAPVIISWGPGPAILRLLPAASQTYQTDAHTVVTKGSRLRYLFSLIAIMLTRIETSSAI